MSLYKRIVGEDFELGIWKVTESLDELLALLPEKGKVYLEDLNIFKSDSRKMEWLAVRVLLYTLTNRIWTIQYYSNGKPYLVDPSANISISHTKGYVAVIISHAHEVGIDVEKIGDRIHRVAHKFVREDELLLQGSVDTNLLLLNWSAKEVIYKCIGEEGIDFREHLRVDFSQRNETSFVGYEMHTPLKRSFLIHYMLDADFVITWTVCS